MDAAVLAINPLMMDYVCVCVCVYMCMCVCVYMCMCVCVTTTIVSCRSSVLADTGGSCRAQIQLSRKYTQITLDQ